MKIITTRPETVSKYKEYLQIEALCRKNLIPCPDEVLTYLDKHIVKAKIQHYSTADTCEVPACNELVTTIIYRRSSNEILAVCAEHSENLILMDRQDEKISTICPNCKCYFLVGWEKNSK